MERPRLLTPAEAEEWRRRRLRGEMRPHGLGGWFRLCLVGLWVLSLATYAVLWLFQVDCTGSRFYQDHLYLVHDWCSDGDDPGAARVRVLAASGLGALVTGLVMTVRNAMRPRSPS